MKKKWGFEGLGFGVEGLWFFWRLKGGKKQSLLHTFNRSLHREARKTGIPRRASPAHAAAVPPQRRVTAAAAPQHQATALVVPGAAAGPGRRPQTQAAPPGPGHGRSPHTTPRPLPCPAATSPSLPACCPAGAAPGSPPRSCPSPRLGGSSRQPGASSRRPGPVSARRSAAPGPARPAARLPLP